MDLYIVAGMSALAAFVAVSTGVSLLRWQRELVEYELDTDEVMRRVELAIRAQADVIDSLLQRADATDTELDVLHAYESNLVKAVNAQADEIDGLVERADKTDKELAEALVFAQSITMVTESVISTVERNEREQSDVIQDILLTLVDLIASNSLEGTMRIDGLEFTAYDLNSDEAANKIKAKLMSNDLEKIESLDHEQLNAQLERLFEADIKAAAEKEQQAHKEATFRSMFKHDEGGGNA